MTKISSQLRLRKPRWVSSTLCMASQAQRGRRNPAKQLWEQAGSRVSKDLPDAEAVIRDVAWSGREARTELYCSQPLTTRAPGAHLVTSNHYRL